MHRIVVIFLTMVALGLTGCNTVEPIPTVEVEDLVTGDGPAAVDGDTVTVHYVGKFTTGRIFDSSYADLNPRDLPEDRPLTFVLGSGRVIGSAQPATVIEGWIEGVPGMRVNGRRQLTIPPVLAYGSQGAGCDGDNDCVIPPNTTLVFDIDLLEIRSGS